MTEEDWIEYQEYRANIPIHLRKGLTNSDDNISQTYDQLAELGNTEEDIREGLYFKFVLGQDIMSKQYKYKIDKFLDTKNLTPEQIYENQLMDLLMDFRSSGTFHSNIQEIGILTLADLLEKLKK